MTPFGVTQLSATVASALVAAVWQGAVLVVAVGAGLKLLPRMSAAGRSVVWTATMLGVVVLPFLRLDGAGAATSSAAWSAGWTVDERVSLALVAVWALISVWRAVELLRSAVWLRGIANRAVPVDVDAAVAALLAGAARRVELCSSEEVDRPSVVGFFAPKILVPAALLERLSAEELAQIVLHELEHLRRGDDWTNLLQKLALVVFPLNPALVWIERRLCLERELACDDRVLAATGARKAYAACLANLAEHSLVRRGVSLALGAWERQSEVVRRVQRILARPAAEMSRVQVAAAVAVLLGGVAGGADVLSHAPELVRFAPAVVGVAQSAPMQSSSFEAGVKAPHATNVLFVAPTPSATPAKRRVVVRRVVARPAVVRKPLVEPVKVAASDEVVPPQSVADAPVVVTVTWREATPVAVQDLQFRYAVVPVRNGWLFVQL